MRKAFVPQGPPVEQIQSLELVVNGAAILGSHDEPGLAIIMGAVDILDGFD